MEAQPDTQVKPVPSTAGAPAAPKTGATASLTGTRAAPDGGRAAPVARRPTMRHVAEEAGVSLATVSRVINGGHDVRPDLAERVRAAVDALGYRRDHTASALRRTDRASASIGLIIDNVANPFFSALHRGVEDVARARGVVVLAGSSDERPERERELTDTLGARGIDGLVLVPCGRDQAYLGRDRELGLPLAFADRMPRGLDADAALTENAAGARTAVEHLLRAGHRRIAFLSDRGSVYTAAERRRGYRAALAAAGIGPDPALERESLSAPGAAEAAVRELLARPEPPTALFSSQNLITVPTVRTLHALGRERDVAFVGFDDVEMSDVVTPGLTVVRQDPYALGHHAAELLFSRLAGYDGPSRRIVVATSLVPRGSGELPPAPHVRSPST
jgi:LacI family transcriptional regulator